MHSTDHGNYDVIGDIHGNATQLDNLLRKLSYKKTEKGYYSHPSRKVIFLGDFVDGGKEHVKVIGIVKPMVENQAAYAIMGNHEFNAISFHTKHPATQQPLRERSIKNIGQHIEFLAEYKSQKKDLLAVIEWFKTLPLFLDLPQIRAVHACWSEHEINIIKPYLTAKNEVKPELFEEFYVRANSKGSDEFNAVEILLKGVEIELPQGASFKDKSENVRTAVRIKWWQSKGNSYGDYSLVRLDKEISKLSFPREAIKPYLYNTDSKPVFIGHYWLSGAPEIQHKKVACLDYSVGKSNNQVAYRWNNGDTQLNNHNFLCSLGGSGEV
jgi:hypothetical protein